MKSVFINKENFIVKENEYNVVPHQEFNNLQIIDSLAEHERIISLLSELSFLFEKSNLLVFNCSHGGYIPIKVADKFEKIGVIDPSDTNWQYNTSTVKNITSAGEIFDSLLPYIFYLTSNVLDDMHLYVQPRILIFNSSLDFKKLYPLYTIYNLSYSNYSILVNNELVSHFNHHFRFYLKENNVLDYDNLIHLAMIVKNAGDSFESILTQNLDFIDRWTILDTGSTDDTISTIKRVLKNKKGQLFQEPFINFKDSRNRCLDLAGTSCKFILTLDDTYIIKNNLREFLQTIRGDQFGDSYSIFIQSDDTEYGSNRIIKSATNLRYIYRIHEVIDPKNNINVIIPKHHSYLFDFRSDYMENRTMDRKKYDLEILFKELEDFPDDPRALYYLAQTYNLLHDHENAFKYFLLRVEHPNDGFIQEKIDACFEAGRLSNFQLNKPWKVSQELYLRAYEMDKSRPDSLYFLGIHYYLEQNMNEAYKYMMEAFKVSYPVHCQYSLKPTLSFFFLPKFLTEICYYVKDYKLGLESAKFFMTNNEKTTVDYYTVSRWEKIFTNLLALQNEQLCEIPSKPILAFLVDGGFTKWSGSDILKNGMGGSETFIVEIARYCQQLGYFDCVVFCNCTTDEYFEGVYYKSLTSCSSFFAKNKIHSVIVSRYPEYLPACYDEPNIENVYLILHDLIPDGEIIIKHPKLKKVFLLSEFHKQFFDSMFPLIQPLTSVFGYGVDIDLFENRGELITPLKFVYSSFVNRGLLPLLQMWEKIHSKFPSASLHIHCDSQHNWVKSILPEHIEEIQLLLKKLDNHNIFYKGWTSKKELADTYKTADILLYPCIFQETFCLTALESAISKTLVITSKSGALVNTVGDRGILIEGDPMTETWQNECMILLSHIIQNKTLKNALVESNYQYAKNLSWKNRAKELICILEPSILI